MDVERLRTVRRFDAGQTIPGGIGDTVPGIEADHDTYAGAGRTWRAVVRSGTVWPRLHPRLNLWSHHL